MVRCADADANGKRSTASAVRRRRVVRIMRSFGSEVDVCSVWRAAKQGAGRHKLFLNDRVNICLAMTYDTSARKLRLSASAHCRAKDTQVFIRRHSDVKNRVHHPFERPQGETVAPARTQARSQLPSRLAAP